MWTKRGNDMVGEHFRATSSPPFIGDSQWSFFSVSLSLSLSLSLTGTKSETLLLNIEHWDLKVQDSIHTVFHTVFSVFVSNNVYTPLHYCIHYYSTTNTTPHHITPHHLFDNGQNFPHAWAHLCLEAIHFLYSCSICLQVVYIYIYVYKYVYMLYSQFNCSTVQLSFDMAIFSNSFPIHLHLEFLRRMCVIFIHSLYSPTLTHIIWEILSIWLGQQYSTFIDSLKR